MYVYLTSNVLTRSPTTVSICLTEGKDAAKASVIFAAIEQCFESENMLWNNCVSLSVDNTNVMISKRNSVTSRFINKNPELCVAGCPCHLAHIAAGHANDAFSDHININIKDVCDDVFYWFVKSTKRKASFLHIFNFVIKNFKAFLNIFQCNGFHLNVVW